MNWESFGLKVFSFMLMQGLALPLNFLFIFAWSHSVTELWPHLFPHMGYWQGYLFLTVVNSIFPFRAYAVK